MHNILFLARFIDVDLPPVRYLVSSFREQLGKLAHQDVSETGAETEETLQSETEKAETSDSEDKAGDVNVSFCCVDQKFELVKGSKQTSQWQGVNSVDVETMCQKKNLSPETRRSGNIPLSKVKLSDHLNNLADSLPYSGFTLDVYIINPQINTENESFAHLLGSLMRLREWHSAQFTIIHDKPDRVELLGSVLHAAVLPARQLSCAHVPLWRGVLVWPSETGDKGFVQTGVSLECEDLERIKEKMVTVYYWKPVPKKKKKKFHVEESKSKTELVFGRRLEVLTCVDIASVHLYLIDNFDLQLHMKQDSRFWKLAKALTHRETLLLRLGLYEKSSLPDAASLGLSTSAWKEGIATAGRPTPDPEKEWLPCREHLFMLITSRQQVSSHLTAIVMRSPSEINPAVFGDFHYASYFGFSDDCEAPEEQTEVPSVGTETVEQHNSPLSQSTVVHSAGSTPKKHTDLPKTVVKQEEADSGSADTQGKAQAHTESGTTQKVVRSGSADTQGKAQTHTEGGTTQKVVRSGSADTQGKAQTHTESGTTQKVVRSGSADTQGKAQAHTEGGTTQKVVRSGSADTQAKAQAHTENGTTEKVESEEELQKQQDIAEKLRKADEMAEMVKKAVNDLPIVTAAAFQTVDKAWLNSVVECINNEKKMCEEKGEPLELTTDDLLAYIIEGQETFLQQAVKQESADVDAKPPSPSDFIPVPDLQGPSSEWPEKRALSESESKAKVLRRYQSNDSSSLMMSSPLAPQDSSMDAKEMVKWFKPDGTAARDDLSPVKPAVRLPRLSSHEGRNLQWPACKDLQYHGVYYEHNRKCEKQEEFFQKFRDKIMLEEGHHVCAEKPHVPALKFRGRSYRSQMDVSCGGSKLTPITRTLSSSKMLAVTPSAKQRRDQKFERGYPGIQGLRHLSLGDRHFSVPKPRIQKESSVGRQKDWSGTVFSGQGNLAGVVAGKSKQSHARLLFGESPNVGDRSSSYHSESSSSTLPPIRRLSAPADSDSIFALPTLRKKMSQVSLGSSGSDRGSSYVKQRTPSATVTSSSEGSHQRRLSSDSVVEGDGSRARQRTPSSTVTSSGHSYQRQLSHEWATESDDSQMEQRRSSATETSSLSVMRQESGESICEGGDSVTKQTALATVTSSGDSQLRRWSSESSDGHTSAGSMPAPVKESRSQRHKRRLEKIVSQVLIDAGIRTSDIIYSSCFTKLFQVTKFYVMQLPTSHNLNAEMRAIAEKQVQQVVDLERRRQDLATKKKLRLSSLVPDKS